MARCRPLRLSRSARTAGLPTAAAAWVAIERATASTYTLVAEDKGAEIAVEVRGSKSGYTPVSMTSEATAVVE